MNSALVIVHADEPFLNSKINDNLRINDIYLEKLITDEVKNSLNTKEIYFIATVTNQKPHYLSSFSNSITLIEDDALFHQLIKCKSLLFKNNINKVELAGLFCLDCVYEFYLGLNGRSKMLIEQIQIPSFINQSSFSKSELEELTYKPIKTIIRVELTDFIVDNIEKNDIFFFKFAKKYNLSNITTQLKRNFIKYKLSYNS